MNTELKNILEQVASGELSVRDAELLIKKEPFADLGYAKVDMHRRFRQGAAEVIYGAGKTAEQIAGIVTAMRGSGEPVILITRLDAEKAESLTRLLEEDAASRNSSSGAAGPVPPAFRYDPLSRCAVIGTIPKPDGIGRVVIATGGTSDIPVAEEAALTAEVLGSEVVRLYDVGVAGLHRLLTHMDELMSAEVVVAIAGMEGALASVIGGLVDCPVIAVPTSIGYGASFGGVSALLSMLNSCASGVSVVNIDNGFGAGFLANRINHR